MQIRWMGRTAHPLKSRAVRLMREGLATAGEIAAALDIPFDTVASWRRRTCIRTNEARVEHVRQLLLRQPRPVPVIDDPDAAPF